MFPVWLITLSLVCLLAYLTYKTLTKGLRLHRSESAASANKPELHTVEVDQQEHEAHVPVHNLLRSISEEPDIPTKSASHAPSLPSIAETSKQNSLAPHTEQTLRTQPQELALVMHNSPASQSVQLSASDASAGKALSHDQLQPIMRNGSAQSLKIRSEADAAALAQDMSQSELTLNAASRPQSSSSTAESVLSLASSSSSFDDAIPLLQQSSSSGNPVQGHEGTDMLSSWSLQQSASPRQTLTWTIWYRDALDRLPLRKLSAALLMWVVFAGLQMWKGHTSQCSTPYWLLYVLQAILLLAASMFFVHQACRAQRDEITVGHTSEGLGNEQEWTHTALIGASAVGIGGGALASTIGMGGGVVMGPLLLTLQVHPLATAATSTLMILFSSSAATLSFAVDGKINAQYAMIYGACNMLSSFAGVFVIGRIVRKSGKSAVIVILLACVMAAGATASAVFGGRESVRDFRTGTNLTFTSLCA